MGSLWREGTRVGSRPFWVQAQCANAPFPMGREVRQGQGILGACPICGLAELGPYSGLPSERARSARGVSHSVRVARMRMRPAGVLIGLRPPRSRLVSAGLRRTPGSAPDMRRCPSAPSWVGASGSCLRRRPCGQGHRPNCSRFANPHQPILKQPPLRSALVIGSCWSVLSA